MTFGIGRKLACLILSCLSCSSPTIAAGPRNQPCTEDLYCKDLAGHGLPDWTHIVWIGPQTYPQPLIWLSHDHLNTLSLLETGVILTISEYRSVASVPIKEYANRPTRSLIDGKLGAFRVTQRIGSARSRTYYLSAVGGCGYMAAILSLKDVKWAPGQKAPFLEYKTICKIQGVPLP